MFPAEGAASVARYAVVVGPRTEILARLFRVDGAEQKTVVQVGRTLAAVAERPSLPSQPASEAVQVRVVRRFRIWKECDDGSLGQARRG